MNYPDYYIRNEKLCTMMETAIEKKEPILWLFTGAPGTGKTLSAEIMFEALCQEIEHLQGQAEKLTANELYYKYQNFARSKDYEERSQTKWCIKTLCNKIVLLDDLGSEPRTEASFSFMQNLFSVQYNWLREGNRNFVIITTNLNSNEITDIYGERVIDRIYEYYTIVKFTGTSFRRKKMKIVEV